LNIILLTREVVKLKKAKKGGKFLKAVLISKSERKIND
jgi:hypothetical protein